MSTGTTIAKGFLQPSATSPRSRPSFMPHNPVSTLAGKARRRCLSFRAKVNRIAVSRSGCREGHGWRERPAGPMRRLGRHGPARPAGRSPAPPGRPARRWPGCPVRLRAVRCLAGGRNRPGHRCCLDPGLADRAAVPGRAAPGLGREFLDPARCRPAAFLSRVARWCVDRIGRAAGGSHRWDPFREEPRCR